MSNLKRNGKLRWSPSYLRNRGTITRAQKRAMREWWPEVGILFEHGKKIDLTKCFESTGPLLIEIGFGMGDHLVALAKSLPRYRFLGIEVHRPGLASTTAKIHEAGLKNIRLIRGDARLVLTDHLEKEIAEAVLVQFPEPWQGEGNQHRRLIQPGMTETIQRTLKQEGEFSLATDIEEYADHCRSVFAGMKGWTQQEQSRFQKFRICTRYEKKGIDEGRSIHELSYRKTPEK
ncbi:MAG: tRNA (guanosine(46)-N7)-methyltransferase TrmB [Verrucomicrobiales bacterium]|nr:tRNA (guanosine(46)-N7)-methyltransferase TrmB [Verrucomicrobiales bacterium]